MDSAVDSDLAAVFRIWINAAQNLHQGGFARTVLPNQRMDFSMVQVKRHPVQSLYPRKGLGDLAHFKIWCCLIGFGHNNKNPCNLAAGDEPAARARWTKITLLLWTLIGRNTFTYFFQRLVTILDNSADQITSVNGDGLQKDRRHFLETIIDRLGGVNLFTSGKLHCRVNRSICKRLNGFVDRHCLFAENN